MNFCLKLYQPKNISLKGGENMKKKLMIAVIIACAVFGVAAGATQIQNQSASELANPGRG
jgi:hypothetical protein